MKIKVGVIYGGKSVEHEISVISALQAIGAFDKDNYDVVPIYITKSGKWYSGSDLLNVEEYKSIDNLLAKCTEIYLSPTFDDFVLHPVKSSFWKKSNLIKIDVAFPVVHGSNGEDGTLQGLLELKGIPYVGCDVLSSAIGMDKIMMKMVLRESSLPVVDYIWFTHKDWYSNQPVLIEKVKQLGFPLIIKPANLGSSVGISKASDEKELINAVDLAGNFSNRILVEKMVVHLKEINCSVIGDSENQTASVCEEPLSSGDILSYNDKYITKGGKSKGMTSTKRKIPAEISENLTSEIKELAKQTFKTLSCSGVSRIDFLIDQQVNKVFVNEINTIPGSLAFYLWESSDKTFSNLLKDLIDLAFKRQRERANIVMSYNENIFNMTAGLTKAGK